MMSISLERNCDAAIGRSRFLHGMRRGSIYDSATGGAFAGDRRVPDGREEDSDSSSSTSIGRNSDLSSEDEDPGETEVRSSYKDPLDTMDALEDVLPVRKGISKFYNGKSKSFTSLADACDVKEIAKPENPYTNKRKNLLAHTMFNPLRNNSRVMSKKLSICSRSSVGLGTVALSSSESNNNSDDCNSLSSSPACSRPPLHPRSQCVESTLLESRSSPWRSFSLSNLQSIAATPNSEERVH